MIKGVLLVLLLLVTIAVVYEKRNKVTIVYFSVFSAIAASLYFYSQAPDVALAEIAVGSAFIPLIFLIAISKQRTFTVMQTMDEPFAYEQAIRAFCEKENLKLNMVQSKDIEDEDAKSIYGAFRKQDIDVILEYEIKGDYYKMTCKQSNVIMDRFQNALSSIHQIRMVRTVDEETID